MAPCPVQANVANAIAPHTVTSQRLGVGNRLFNATPIIAITKAAIRTIQVNPTSVPMRTISKM
ncbi:hypothetical protein D9M73_236160 [compost metagenome]